MNDIAKMRAEFEQKLQWAELENEHNERLEPEKVSLHIVGHSITQKGKLQAYFEPERFGTLPNVKAGMVLSMYPVTEDLTTFVGHDTYEQMMYRLETRRSPRDPWTILKIEWISGDFDLSCEVALDGSDESVMQFFQKRHRTLEESEISSYGIQKTRYNKDTRDFFPHLGFASGTQTHFKGGNVLCTQHSLAMAIVERFKYLYEFQND